MAEVDEHERKAGLASRRNGAARALLNDPKPPVGPPFHMPQPCSDSKVKGAYLAKLLENAKVTKFLKQQQPEMLEQFVSIVEATALE